MTIIVVDDEAISRAVRGTRVRAVLVEKYWDKATADKFREAMRRRDPDDSQEVLRLILCGQPVSSSAKVMAKEIGKRYGAKISGKFTKAMNGRKPEEGIQVLTQILQDATRPMSNSIYAEFGNFVPPRMRFNPSKRRFP
ncbi:MAG: hypothetical protein RLZZ347_116 [Candidatus Parcubacteria bacterium]|jgi:hypothetical protein